MKRKNQHEHVTKPVEGETYYALYCKPAGTFNGVDGKPTKDLNQAALFTGETAAQHTEQFRPNFEFIAVRITNGKRVEHYGG